MSNKITMQHIADVLGVSKYVVSKALSDKGGVNPATRERVRQTAVKLGYRFNSKLPAGSDPVGKALPSDRQTFVVLLPNLNYNFRDSLYWGRIVDGISKELESQNINGVVLTEQSVESFLSIVNKDSIKGFIAVGRVAGEVLQEVNRMKMPIVLIDHEEPLIETTQLYASNRECVYRLTNHLISLGHRSIRFAGNASFSKSFLSRWNGYKDAMQENGLYIGEDPLSSLDREFWNEHTGQIQAILAADRGRSGFPTAIVCANDAIAVNAMRALELLGCRVPEDVSITGFDNTEEAYLSTPALTTVNLEKELMGRRAVQVMIGMIQHPEFPKETIYVNASLMLRESVAPIRNEAERD